MAIHWCKTKTKTMGSKTKSPKPFNNFSRRLKTQWSNINYETVKTVESLKRWYIVNRCLQQINCTWIQWRHIPVPYGDMLPSNHNYQSHCSNIWDRSIALINCAACQSLLRVFPCTVRGATVHIFRIRHSCFVHLFCQLHMATHISNLHF